MQISTSTNLCAFQPGRERLSTAFCIETCAEAGYKVLDVNLCEAMNPDSRLRDDDWEKYALELKSLAGRLGIVFRQSHLPYYDIFGKNAQDKAPLMEKLIRRSIIVSAILGVRWTVTHPGTDYEAGFDTKRSLEKNIEYYAPLVELAKQNGVGIALENDFEYRSKPLQRIYCASPYELAGLCDAFGDPEYVGVCYDFGHAHLAGGFHTQNLHVIGKRIKALHVQDNHGVSDEHLLPFHGTIPWREAMSALADVGYEGDLTFEAQEFGRFLPKEQKRLVASYSLQIGKVLLDMFNDEKKRISQLSASK